MGGSKLSTEGYIYLRTWTSFPFIPFHGHELEGNGSSTQDETMVDEHNWGLVDESQTANYVEISTTQTPDWSEVA